MTGKMDKCSLKGDFITPCHILDKKLNDYDSRGKGLHFLEYKNMVTFEKTREFISYKMNSKDKGLILNFCPWCGEKLHNEFEENKC